MKYETLSEDFRERRYLSIPDIKYEKRRVMIFSRFLFFCVCYESSIDTNVQSLPFSVSKPFDDPPIPGFLILLLHCCLLLTRLLTLFLFYTNEMKIFCSKRTLNLSLYYRLCLLNTVLFQCQKALYNSS